MRDTAAIVPLTRPSLARRRRIGVAALVAYVAVALGGCGATATKTTSTTSGPVHASGFTIKKLVDAGRPPYITGLAVDPAGGSILLATNLGFFRVSANGRQIQAIHSRVRAGGREGPFGQRVSSLAYLDADHLLGSGHPNWTDTKLPPFLGVIESTDDGASWRSIARVGFSDLHVLLVVNGVIYGYDTVLGGVVVSTDGGHAFVERNAPGGAVVVDLVADPHAPRYLLATTPTTLYRSGDEGRTWHKLDAAVESHLAWTPNGLFRADASGTVWTSSDRGLSWRHVSKLPRAPGKLVEVPNGTLYAALDDGAIVVSRDRGHTWHALFPS